MTVAQLIAPKKKGRPTAPNRPNAEWLLTMYQSATATELAKEYKVSKQTIYTWIREAREELLQKNNN